MSERCTCRYCGHPEANDRDWAEIPEGEGDHLCWGECGVDAETALDNRRKDLEDLRESVRRLAESFRRKCDAHTDRWETESKDKDLGLAVAYNDACKELSALIDGKGEQNAP